MAKKKTTHSKNFERYKKWYTVQHSITIEQLEELVAVGLLTQAEFDEIVGSDGTPNG